MTKKLDQPGPGLHALVIGVNLYRHLDGGGGAERLKFKGLAQLLSPVHSALHLARWLTNERVDATSPLRSLQVLVTSPQDNATDLLSAGVPCVAPTMANIKDAFFQLMRRGSEFTENKLLVYFCGHGLSFAGTDTLLTEDFGANEWDDFEHAVNVDYLLGGMSHCKAGSQLFLFDSCRVDGKIFPPVPRSFGEPIINLERLQSVDAKQVSIWAANVGQRAIGYKDGRPSVFSEGVIAALRGAAARRERSRYLINTSRMKEAIDAYVRARARGIKQITELRNTTYDFAIAELQNPPIIPVTVHCQDEAVLPDAEFSCWSYPRKPGEEALQSRAPENVPWHVDIAMGLYDFDARFVAQNRVDTRNEEVEPPYSHVTF
ncbi:hypothetical protein ACV22Y_32770 [Burkholderia sp. AW50-3]